MEFTRIAEENKHHIPYGECYEEVWLSDCQKIVLFKYKVMYGYRIRASHKGAFAVTLDWCCGDDHYAYTLLFKMLLRILSHRDAANAFHGLPRFSSVKPYYYDDAFFKKVYNIYKGCIMELVE